MVEGRKKATVTRMEIREQEMNETMNMMQVAKLAEGNSTDAGNLLTTEELKSIDTWGGQTHYRYR